MVVSALSHTPSTCCTHEHRAAALGSGINISGLANAADLANSTSRITSLPNTLGASCLSSSPSHRDGRGVHFCTVCSNGNFPRLLMLLQFCQPGVSISSNKAPEAVNAMPGDLPFKSCIYLILGSRKPASFN